MLKHSLIAENGERKDRRVESYNPKDLSRKDILKVYEGRIKQLSPDIIEKILKKEKEKQKIQSIIGTKWYFT